MTRYVRVPIEAEERECGKCHHLRTYDGRQYGCLAFLDESRYPTVPPIIDHRPQRHAACLNAEIKEIADEVAD